MSWWPVDKPIPYAKNTRKIPGRAIDKVAASIKEFGWRQAIVVDKGGVIICGHTRLLAAKKLGLTQVPVQVADNLTPAQVKAYRLMDNRSHDETSFDLERLGPELEELRGLDFDLGLTGFDPHEIDVSFPIQVTTVPIPYRPCPPTPFPKLATSGRRGSIV